MAVLPDDIEIGATYFCDDQKFRTVESMTLNGARVSWRIADDLPGTTTSGECPTIRFAGMCVRRELEECR